MKIIVLSRNAALYSTQSIVGAAIRRGHDVRVIDHLQCDLVIERGRNQVYFQNERISDVDAIIPRIGSSATTYGAAVIRHFESQKIFSTLKADALLLARNKICCLQVLSGQGLGVPKTMVCNNPFVLEEMLEKIPSYPKVVKLANGTHGLGVILVENEQTATSILEAFTKTKQRALTQEFIKEAKGADVRVFVVDQEIVGVMQRQARAGEFRSNLHRGGTSFVVKLTEKEEQVAKKAARILGVKVAGVDMLRSAKGPLILEVNASPGLEGIENTTKLDIASKIIQFVERSAFNKI